MRSYSQLSEFDLLLSIDLDLSKMNHFHILTEQLIPGSFITPQLKLWSGSCSQTEKQTNRQTQADRQTDRQTDQQTNKQTDKQTRAKTIPHQSR